MYLTCSAISGSNLDVIEDIITGLPVSDHDHAVNGLEFGDHGELYILVGGNTNAGVPGAMSGSNLQKEGLFSAAALVAYLGRDDFDGHLLYDQVDDGNLIKGSGIEVFSSGLRNPYDLVLHSINGNIYATDNGPNTGYGKKSVGCDQGVDDVDEEDELNLLTSTTSLM
jgi:glucose/arabinose dehydrogenase